MTRNHVESLELVTHSARETFDIGTRLGALLAPGDTVCLEGDLGSGKTCLTQGIGHGMGVDDVITSPTFVLINEYIPSQRGGRLYHVDLYRIEREDDLVTLGLEDYIYGNGITVIEWAERARDYMPRERLWVTLTYLDPSSRRLRFEAVGAHYAEVVRALREALTGHAADDAAANTAANAAGNTGGNAIGME
ncbi:MAG TPA: tRNA (adenosine(37)-N6)-threonylcarbamoyltransferase complex ATPase subunit type 1 TsaE [Chloroflexi bacterium]|nr:tRNA (adenosine(37)-N6)-threonylcarbamoyltransferase complex ATPase subunit type 1 TsaE [Chloroflexota bacterium]